MAIDITGKAAGAIAAYANTAKIADGIPSEERVGNVKNNVSFGDLVREGIEGHRIPKEKRAGLGAGSCRSGRYYRCDFCFE